MRQPRPQAPFQSLDQDKLWCGCVGFYTVLSDVIIVIAVETGVLGRSDMQSCSDLHELFRPWLVWASKRFSTELEFGP